MRYLKIIGLKCSIFCCVLSTWGIIQLGTMALLLHMRSVAFADDIPEVSFRPEKPDEFSKGVDSGYDASAFNCWMGASVYCAFLVFSLCQCAVNFMEEPEKANRTRHH